MTQRRFVAAFAIEDQIDFRFSDGETMYVYTEPLRQRGDYYRHIRISIVNCFSALLSKLDLFRAPRELFSSLDAIVISTPGVVRENRVLEQITLWNFGPASGSFDFAEEMATVAHSLMKEAWSSWGQWERERFIERVFVVNDATACAAFEIMNRRDLGKAQSVVFLKVHNGVNIGLVGRTSSSRIEINASHAEAGHIYPILHKSDRLSQYRGCCQFHDCCMEGMVSAHSLYERASLKDSDEFRNWSVTLGEIDSTRFPLDEMDGLFATHVLSYRQATDTKSEMQLVRRDAINIVSMYITQLAHMISLLLTPTYLVIGGRLATDDVLSAVRKGVSNVTRGYPSRPGLQAEGIGDYILGAHVSPDDWNAIEKGEVEIGGAWEIAKSKAELPWSWGGTRVPLQFIGDPSNKERLKPKPWRHPDGGTNNV